MVQDNQTSNSPVFTDASIIPNQGKIVAIDPGTKRTGVAACDVTQTVVRRISILPSSNWKKLLVSVSSIVADLDAIALVVGLPLNTDGSESEMSETARRYARNFSLSLEIPVILCDERVTSWKARENLWKLGKSLDETRDNVDSEAAAVILEDFLSHRKTV